MNTTHRNTHPISTWSNEAFRNGMPSLTPRETEVLRLVAEGRANKETASELGISLKTVEKHRGNLMDKLGIHNTAGLTRYAIGVGLITVFSLALGGSFLGCSTPSDDRYSSATKNEVAQNEKKFRFKGTVVHHRSDGGYYTLRSDSGFEYYPLNLDSSYRKSGMRVQVYGEGRGYALGGRMRAIQIFDIARISSLN